MNDAIWIVVPLGLIVLTLIVAWFWTYHPFWEKRK